MQSSDGHSLLFAIDSSGIFHLIEEQSGTSHNGWQIYDLSSTALKSQFLNRESEVVVRTFDVAQNATDGSINLMMVATINSNDYLFISLGHSSDDTSWKSHLIWTMVPFDPENEASQNITIASTLFAETEGNRKQYMIVDIDRPSGNMSDPHITRYYIDPNRVNGHYWTKHDVTIDIASGQYQSVVGRMPGQPIDGIYTAGSTGGKPQLVYEPIINEYGDGPVLPLRLRLPEDIVPSAIATVRNTQGFSDLFAVGGSTLYYFPANMQEDNAEPTELITNGLLSGTDTLRIMTHDGITTLWGRNSSYAVYYLSCPADQLINPNSWSSPMLILSAVERMSSYVNRADGGNTVFASGNGRLQRLMQSSAATSKAWRAHDITLAAPPTQKAHSFKSYTTSIHVTQLDKELPASKAVVNLSASSRTPVYINGLYYVLSPLAIQVAADVAGSLTVAEAIDSMHAAILTVSLDNTTITINPMDHVFAKLTSLNSEMKLRNAQFPTQTVAGGIIGSTEFTPLITSSVTDDDVKSGAQGLGLLDNAYAQLQNPTKKISNVQLYSHQIQHRSAPAFIIPVAQFNIFGDFWNKVKTWVGDVKKVITSLGKVISSAFGEAIQWVKHEAEAVARVVHDTVTGTMHFFAKVGEKIYHAALDTFHAIVGAAQWLFDKLKAGFETLTHFLEALFHWDDIRRSKDVMHNTIKLWLQDQVDNIPLARKVFDGTVAAVEKQVNDFANITNWSPALADVGKKPASGIVSNISQNQTPSSKFLGDKYRDHGSQLTIVGQSPTLNVVESLLSDLVTAISNEGHVLGAVFTQLQDLTKQFSSLTVEDVLKRLTAILIDGVLSSVQVVADAVLSVLYDIAQSAIQILDTKIHIPIISDLLNAIGIPDISFLDLFTWIGASAFTIIYKTAEGHAPFPDKDTSVKAIISASSWNDMTGLFGQPGTTEIFSSSSTSSSFSTTHAAQHKGIISLPTSIMKAVFEGCHMNAGIIGLVGNFSTAMEAEDQEGNTLIGIQAVVIGIMCAASTAAGDLLVPMYPVTSLPFRILSGITSILVIGGKLFFSSLAQKGLKKLNQKVNIGSIICEDARGVGAMFNAFLVLPGAAVTLWHFYELGQKSKDTTRDAAIIGEVSNLASYVSRLAYALAVNDEEQDSRLVAILVMGAANDVLNGLQLTEVGVGKSAFS